MSTRTRSPWDVAAELPDPEIPVITIAELGILRSADVDDAGKVTVTITPTYSGCPAMRAIETSIVEALNAAGYEQVDVETRYSPAWTTDWIADEAKRKLEEYGIAPPARLEVADDSPVLCPQCASEETTVVSPFGSTACKALMVCSSCGEPFDHFKSL